jgi:Outer membrane efflux protein
MKKIFASLGLVIAVPAFAQDAATFKLDDVSLRPIKFSEFVAQVKESNTWVRSKKLSNESAASWQQSMSAYNINPSFSYSRGTFYAAAPMESYRSPQSGTYTLSGNIEGRGKQDARKEFSSAEVIRQSVDLGALVFGVEVDSAFLFLDALRVKNLWLVKHKAIAELERIGSADNKQAIDDYKQFRADQANDFKYFALGMASYLGKPSAVLPDPTAELNVTIRDFDVRSLVDNAKRARPDVLSLEAAFSVAKAADNLAQKNRRLDYSVSVYATDTPAYSVYSADYGTTTEYNRGISYGFSISVPIPVSQLYDADLVAAKNARLQAEIMLEDAKNRVYFEVNQALIQFNSAKAKLQTALDNQKNLAGKKMANLDDVNNWHAAEVEAIDAKVNYAKAMLFLGRVSGLKNVLAL